jgi:HJR/Mrr/RecB family endonuclease
MSLFFLFSAGVPAVPVLPADDPRLDQPLIWMPSLAERIIQLLRARRGWDDITPRQLEEVVAELLAGFGYEVELTKRTRDHGRDVIAIRHSNIKDDKYLIECKHWKDSVGVDVVREVLGVGVVEPHSGLIIVSTSGFTRDARVIADREQVRWTLSLKDRDDLGAWVEEYARLKKWLN